MLIGVLSTPTGLEPRAASLSAGHDVFVGGLTCWKDSPAQVTGTIDEGSTYVLMRLQLTFEDPIGPLGSPALGVPR